VSAIYISAAHKSSGKTTVSIGLARALVEEGVSLQTFKKGPDYIDPLWLGAAAGGACYNLDFYTQSREEILACYSNRMLDKGMALIEGNKGLYDGLDIEGSNSNAAMAAFLSIPVVLVINCRGMTRGIAPLLLGYQAFDTQIEIAGVILNQVGGVRHESKLREVVEHYTDIPVLGALQADDRLQIDERHLGLIPSNEAQESERMIACLAGIVRQSVDLERIIAIAGTAAQPPPTPMQKTLYSPKESTVRIGYARDRAFGFYYPDDMERMQALGVDLIPFDTVNDSHLPDIDGIFIGGGFPETAMEALEANTSMRRAIADFIEQGGPVYAECGGLMYLTRSLSWKGKKCRMAGIIPADTVMHEKPQGRGYVRLRERGNSPWPEADPEVSSPDEISAHEFHYSALEGLTAAPGDFAYEVLRGTGIDGSNDGYIYKNLLASYTHMRSVGGNNWVGRFVAHVRACRVRDQAVKVR
jgi:cobyrinic acid a,c-diamide synthase